MHRYYHSEFLEHKMQSGNTLVHHRAPYTHSRVSVYTNYHCWVEVGRKPTQTQEILHQDM